MKKKPAGSNIPITPVNSRNAFPLARPVEGPAYVLAPDAGAALYYQDQRRASPKRFRNFSRLEHKLERDWGPLRLDACETSPAIRPNSGS